MQNYIKSQTRLAFVQYIFQNEFSNTDSLESMEDFQKHFYDTDIAIIDENKKFKLKFNKNFLNRLFSSFQNNNIELFHSRDDSGYKFVANQIITIDKINPQIAARVITPMTNISKFNDNTKKRMKRYLQVILNSNPSTDVFEITSKSLNQ